MLRRSKLLVFGIFAFAAFSIRLSADEGPPPLLATFHILSGLISEPDPTTGPRAFVGSPLVLQADAAGSDLEFDWHMSDGTHLTGVEVTQTFFTPGDVSISLTVTTLTPPIHMASSMISLRILPNFSQGDPLVTFGGNLGNWGTELLLSNPSSQEATVGFDPVPFIQACPGECFPMTFRVPAYGTTKSPPVAPGQNDIEQLSTYYLTTPPATTPPSIRVRTVNGLFPSQTNEIPVVRLSSLIALDPSVLSFPGATSGPIGRSNLVLTGLLLPDLSIGPSVTGAIEARDPNGNLLATAPFTVNSGDTLFIPDVLDLLGVPSLDDGQIRVVRTSSDGYLWGLLATTYSDGSSAISAGANP